MSDRLLSSVIVGFIAGIFVRSFVEMGGAFSWFLMLLGVVVFILPISLSKGSTAVFDRRVVTTPALAASAVYDYSSTPFAKGDKSPVTEDGVTSFREGGILVAVFLFAVGLGMLRYDFAERNSVTAGLEPYSNQIVTFEGLITDEPDVREGNTHLVFRAETADTTAKILLFVPHEPKYTYGDKISVTGKLEHPKNFVDEVSGREVDYKSYLAKDGIFFQMFRPEITLISPKEGNVLLEKLFAFKHAFIGHINTLIPEPHSALLGGLVVGAKQSLGKELLDDFRTVGVIHIVVLSGYNITIIAYFIEWLFSRLRKNLRLALAALSMILFALMVGAGATVVRATIMALLVVLARSTGRIYAVTRALLIAGVIMLLHNPKILVFDVSFQLSFLATLGLIYVSPLIEPKVKWVTEKWHIREIVVATVATQIFVLPFLMYKTGIFSIVSLPVNLLVLSAIPATMLFGFLAGMAGFVWSILALPFAYVAYALLAYELAVVEWFARLPFASASISYFPLWLVILWYGVYAVLFFVWQRKQSTGTEKKRVLS
ncbi:MAG: ComEC/Rec2-related protein [Parcubacteria group bacterium GW2011_GWA2_49_9]|nr:MAG: ComEC/Rec2-related protein [Parcubacteria group bacterium GW2011_GWA2_49_9]